MPSVRVKRSHALYTSLHDVPDTTQPAQSESFLSPTDTAQTIPRSAGRRMSRVSHHIIGDISGIDHNHLSVNRASSYRSSSFSPPHIDTVLHNEDQHRHVGDSLRSAVSSSYYDPEDHDESVVDHLDVIDARISTVSNLTNAAHSILIPSLSIDAWKPTLTLSQIPRGVNPPGDTEKGQTHNDDELDNHVEDVLKNKDNFRRTLLGVLAFLKTPLGIVTAVYGFCVAFWGAAIVMFLTKMINLHNTERQKIWVEISSQVVNGLFTLTGVGLIPLRVLDTYRIYKIWRYKQRTRALREKAGLPALTDEDDLPDPVYDPNDVHVLADKEQQDLRYHQYQFVKSQSWYRPHATNTHRAFPINTALLICCSMDLNSIFQVILCGTMWGLDRFQRPAWTTGVLIPASFLCAIYASILIWRGGQKTKRTAKVEELLRKALNEDNASRPDLGKLNTQKKN